MKGGRAVVLGLIVVSGVGAGRPARADFVGLGVQASHDAVGIVDEAGESAPRSTGGFALDFEFDSARIAIRADSDFTVGNYGESTGQFGDELLNPNSKGLGFGFRYEGLWVNSESWELGAVTDLYYARGQTNGGGLVQLASLDFGMVSRIHFYRATKGAAFPFEVGLELEAGLSARGALVSGDLAGGTYHYGASATVAPYFVTRTGMGTAATIPIKPYATLTYFRPIGAEPLPGFDGFQLVIGLETNLGFRYEPDAEPSHDDAPLGAALAR